LIHPL